MSQHRGCCADCEGCPCEPCLSGSLLNSGCCHSFQCVNSSELLVLKLFRGGTSRNEVGKRARDATTEGNCANCCEFNITQAAHTADPIQYIYKPYAGSSSVTQGSYFYVDMNWAKVPRAPSDCHNIDCIDTLNEALIASTTSYCNDTCFAGTPQDSCCCDEIYGENSECDASSCPEFDACQGQSARDDKICGCAGCVGGSGSSGENCVCWHPGAANSGHALTSYQRARMEESEVYKPTLDILCYADGKRTLPCPTAAAHRINSSALGIHSGDCPSYAPYELGTLPNKSHLSEHMLGWVHKEYWWKSPYASDTGCETDCCESDCTDVTTCCSWVWPKPCDTPDSGCTSSDPWDLDEPANTSLVAPNYFIYACSGAPLFDFQVITAMELGEDNGGISPSEGKALLDSFSNFNTTTCDGTPPSQVTLQKLWDLGFIKPADYREEVVAAYEDMSLAGYSETYGRCETDPLEVPVLAPCRVLGGGYVHPKLMTGSMINLQETLCGDLDPFGAWQIDLHPTIPPPHQSQPSHPDHADWLKWLKASGTFFRAQPGGWSHICTQITGICTNCDEETFPYYPREIRFDSTCQMLGCLDATPSPQCTTCTDNGSGTGCHVNACVSSSASGGNCGSWTVEAACTEPGSNDPALCTGHNYTEAYCFGIHFIHYTYSSTVTGPGTSSECNTCVKQSCARVNHAYLTTIDNHCKWVGGEHQIYECDFLTDEEIAGQEATFGFPSVSRTHYQAGNACSTTVGDAPCDGPVGDLCCGGMCQELGAQGYCNTECDDLRKLEGDCPPTASEHRPQARAAQACHTGVRGACCVACGTEEARCIDFLTSEQCSRVGGTWKENAHCCDSSTPHSGSTDDLYWDTVTSSCISCCT